MRFSTRLCGWILRFNSLNATSHDLQWTVSYPYLAPTSVGVYTICFRSIWNAHSWPERFGDQLVMVSIWILQLFVYCHCVTRPKWSKLRTQSLQLTQSTSSNQSPALLHGEVCALETFCPTERWSLYDRAEQGLLHITGTVPDAGTSELWRTKSWKAATSAQKRTQQPHWRGTTFSGFYAVL